MATNPNIKKAPRKTNRVELVRALWLGKDILPKCSDIQNWCDVIEKCFGFIDLVVYCHKSSQITLSLDARSNGKWLVFEKANCHCDVQHDISKLNRDTVDPSLANTDPMFPRATHWIFYNDISNSNKKCIDLNQLESVARYCDSIRVNNSGCFVSSDGHICKSSPEYVIEEWLVKNNIRHVKEGDIDKSTGKRATEYPHDVNHNPNRRSIEADWEICPGKLEHRIFVEYFEGKGFKGYTEKVERKRKLAMKHNITLIELWRPDLDEIIFQAKFKDLVSD